MGMKLFVTGIILGIVSIVISAHVFAQPVPRKEGKDNVTLNYDGDIKQVIKAVLEELGEPYVIDKNVRGHVTVRTGKKLRREELLPFLRVILSSGGFRLLKKEDVYTIEKVNIQAIPMLPVYTDDQISKFPKGQRLVLLVLPLRETRADSMAKIVSSYLSVTGRLSYAPEINALLVADYPANLRSMKALDDILDVNKYTLKVFPLKIADALEVVGELDKIFAEEILRKDFLGDLKPYKYLSHYFSDMETNF